MVKFSEKWPSFNMFKVLTICKKNPKHWKWISLNCMETKFNMKNIFNSWIQILLHKMVLTVIAKKKWFFFYSSSTIWLRFGSIKKKCVESINRCMCIHQHDKGRAILDHPFMPNTYSKLINYFMIHDLFLFKCSKIKWNFFFRFLFSLFYPSSIFC